MGERWVLIKVEPLNPFYSKGRERDGRGGVLQITYSVWRNWLTKYCVMRYCNTKVLKKRINKKDNHRDNEGDILSLFLHELWFKLQEI